MFGALGRLLRGFVAIFTGRADRAADQLQRNPDAMRAEYNSIIEEQNVQLRQYIQVDGSRRADKARRIAQLETVTEEIGKFKRGIQGAKAKLTALKDALLAQGQTREQIEQNPDFVKWRDAIRDYSTTLEEKERRAADAKADIESDDARIGENLRGMRSLQRRMEETARSRDMAVENILSADNRKQMAAMEAGISADTTSDRLARLKRIEAEAVAEADSAEALAGTVAGRQLDEAIAAIAKDELDTELDTELWGEKPEVTAVDKAPATPERLDSRLPE
jgi:chromosome segregation ATPase